MIFLYVFALSVFSVVLREPLPMLPVLLSALSAAIISKAPAGQVLRRLRSLWVMIVSVTLLQAFFSADIVHGLLVGATVLQRLAILMLGGTLLARYPGHALVQAMLQLRLPYQLAYMLSIGLRFVPQFSQSYRDSLAAIQLRGVELRRLQLRARLRVYTWLLMPTVAAGIHSARRLAMAMELRGFGAQETRSAYAPLRMKKRDWLAFAGILFWMVMFIASYIIWKVYT